MAQEDALASQLKQIRSQMQPIIDDIKVVKTCIVSLRDRTTELKKLHQTTSSRADDIAHDLLILRRREEDEICRVRTTAIIKLYVIYFCGTEDRVSTKWINFCKTMWEKISAAEDNEISPSELQLATNDLVALNGYDTSVPFLIILKILRNHDLHIVCHFDVIHSIKRQREFISNQELDTLFDKCYETSIYNALSIILKRLRSLQQFKKVYL